MNGIDIMIVGVGGQGTLLASKIMGALAIRAGLDVKLSEVHGMAQRGGSVETHVRIADSVAAPLVAPGTADYVLSFEPLEAARAIISSGSSGNQGIRFHQQLPGIAQNLITGKKAKGSAGDNRIGQLILFLSRHDDTLPLVLKGHSIYDDFLRGIGGSEGVSVAT